MSCPVLWSSSDKSIFKFRAGSDLTSVCLNFALRQTIEILDQLEGDGYSADLFHMNFVPNTNLEALIESCRRTGRLLIIDDSKSVTKFGDLLVAQLAELDLNVQTMILTRRGIPNLSYGAQSDSLEINFANVQKFVKK